jgi:hypothetical protein
MPLYRLEGSTPSLHEPVLIAAIDGWVDAAGAASGAVEQLAAGSPVVARFDADELFDYRSRRPVLDVVDGQLRELEWPELTLRHVRVGGRDLLLLTGAEPDLRWHQLAADTLALTRSLGVVQWISLGAVPAAAPHTRPVPIMATASQDGLLAPGVRRGPDGLLRVPAAALSALELSVSRGGVPAVGFFAQVPPYAGSGYAAASVALLQRLSGHLGVELPTGDLPDTARIERLRFDGAAATDPDTREMIERLEAMAGDPDEATDRIPTGDELAVEIQRFLREQSGDEPGGPTLGG